MKIINKKLIIVIVIFLFMVLLILSVFLYRGRDKSRISSEEGYGPRIDSPLIQNAIKEKKKGARFFPFEKHILLSTGVEVSIVVPSEKYQHNEWTTTVQIFGIDYDLPVDDPEYERVKNSFLEASGIVFDWMKSHGVDHKRMIINWGDKAFIQERSEQWLGE